jgi:SAM-dependent methyltransferase
MNAVPFVIDLAGTFGQIDIYLFDQLLRGRLQPGMRVLDAGCGSGRNLHYLLRAGFEVFGADADPRAIAAVTELAARLAPDLPAGNFHLEPIERMTFPDGFADVVISSAVLHFAKDDEQFQGMLEASWRAVRSGGFLFCRLASTIGMEGRMQKISGARYLLPDGSERYLVDEARLVSLTREMNGRLVDPIKTTVVQDQRCMTTWVVGK